MQGSTGRSWGRTCRILTTLRISATRTPTPARGKSALRSPSSSCTTTTRPLGNTPSTPPQHPLRAPSVPPAEPLRAPSVTPCAPRCIETTPVPPSRTMQLDSRSAVGAEAHGRLR
eukprot:1188664-Prorocentrum_minimum.AAC.1